jgi:cytochrome c peroxidase
VLFPAVLLILALVSSAFAEEQFRFVRPVHVVQNKRMTKLLPPSDVRTFRAGVKATADPPEVTIGERLFIDTRFSQYFAANYDGNVNHPLSKGDPTLDTIQVKDKTVHGPFATRSINCRSCHFVAEFASMGISYNRTYADFAQRSSIPTRADGQRTTERNSMSMVDSFIDRNGITLLHADGEFATPEALVKSTMTGRNFGWLPNESDKAMAHIAKVIREDDGTDAISFRYGGSYSKILAGTATDIHPLFRLPKVYTLDVKSASDREILDAVAKLIGAYLKSLAFARDNGGVFNGSPYDLFLKLNGLPAMPDSGESDSQYTARLARAVESLENPKFVDEDAQTTWFQYHEQKFNFGPQELEGLKIFLRRQQESGESTRKKAATLLAIPGALVIIGLTSRRSQKAVSIACVALCFTGTLLVLGGWSAPQESPGSNLAPHVANCTTCHTPPDFSDSRFHNNGSSQEEYDSVHGAGKFAKLAIPGYNERSRSYDKYLPATSQHPNASGVFRKQPHPDKPAFADLGMWNIYANPDFPEPQSQMQKLMCELAENCDPQNVLPLAIARFRTPPLRDLEDSSPFMHTGRFATIEDVVRYYIRISSLARHGEIRNGSVNLNGITIDEHDIAPIVAFLRSLNEDYD